MNKRDALKLKVGDKVIAPGVGVFLPTAITEIITENEVGRLPLVKLEGHKHLVTYLHLKTRS
jgi:hypothetical protein